MDINRKRIAEEFRKRRIFDAKQRQIGLDVDALNYQVHEHRLARARETERERQFADALLRESDVAELLDQKAKEEAREKDKKLNDFRSSEQRPENRKEYDLNDPDRKKKERPPRRSDSDPCPVSSLQKFEGEELDSGNRSRAQKEQVRDQLLQQMQEKRMQNFKRDKDKHDWEIAMLNQDSYVEQLARMGLGEKKRASAVLSDENRSLALQKQESMRRERIEDEIEKERDIEYNLNGEFLNEDPFAARSALGPNRVLPDRWKGMTRKQLDEFHNGQIQQILERKREKDRDLQEQARWDEEIINQENLSKLLEEEGNNQKRELSKKFNSENQQLAQDQRRKQEYFEKVVYTNAASSEFFDQFNTTSR